MDEYQGAMDGEKKWSPTDTWSSHESIGN